MKKNIRKQEKKYCPFCDDPNEVIDYKNTETLRKYTSGYAKILPRKRFGTCAMHQRKLSLAVKRARFMALISFTNR